MKIRTSLFPKRQLILKEYYDACTNSNNYNINLMLIQDLMDHDHDSQDSIDTERAGLLKYTEDKHNEILSHNNELAHLQAKLEEAEEDVLKWSATAKIPCQETNNIHVKLYQCIMHIIIWH